MIKAADEGSANLLLSLEFWVNAMIYELGMWIELKDG